MWSRAELKERCKGVMQKNYWMMFLVSCIAAFLCGNSLININITIQDISYFFQHITYMMTSNIHLSDVFLDLPFSLFSTFVTSFLGIMMFFLSSIMIAFRIFISNPIACGKARFYLKNTKEKATIAELFSCFSTNYMNCVKIMFLRDVKIALFSLLFVVPGIIKYYEYKMIPMILAENPAITSYDAFRKTKDLTRYQKKNMLILDLSFIGWYIIGSLLIIGKLFVHPYYDGVQVELYKVLNKN